MVGGKRQHALEELVATEVAYARDLQDVASGYVDAIPEQVLSVEEKVAIFGNWKQLAAFHATFAEKLQKETPDTIGRCFLQVDFLPIYTRVCCHHDRQLALLTQRMASDPRLCAVLQSCQETLGHRLPLKDYLLTPVQRIMRYHLLLGEQDKHAKEDEPGKALLTEAHATMRDVARCLNERRRTSQLQDLLQGTVALTRTPTLQDRLSGLTVNFADLGPLLGQLSDAVLMMEGKGGKPSQRMVLLFRSAIVSCKEREHNMFSVKAEYNLATCKLKILDAHKFSVIINDDATDKDVYQVTNTDVRALLSDIYALDSSSGPEPSDDVVSPSARRHRLLGNVLRASPRERVFSAGKGKAPQLQQTGHLAMSPSNTQPTSPPSSSENADCVAAAEQTADSLPNDDPPSDELNLWLKETTISNGTPSEFLAVQRVLRDRLERMDTQTRLLTQELRVLVAENAKLLTERSKGLQRDALVCLREELVDARVSSRRLQTELEDTTQKLKQTQQKEQQATQTISGLHQQLRVQEEQLKKLLQHVAEKDSVLVKTQKELAATRASLQEKEATCLQAQDLYRNSSQRYQQLEAELNALKAKYEAIEQEKVATQRHASDLESKVIDQQLQFSNELDVVRSQSTSSRRHKGRSISLSKRRYAEISSDESRTGESGCSIM
eukprot:m.164900 g.164900  ORF g.164900 m.164900 type:complete len:666 (+) comp16419_c0_seq2:231-2228(+)